MDHKSFDTYETGGVVVPDGLGVTEGLKRRVGLDDLVLKVTLHVIGWKEWLSW